MKVLRVDGEPLDACSLAAYVALHCTRLPALHLKVGSSGVFDDFDLDEDMASNTQLHVGQLPIVISLYKVGNSLLVDSTHDEQACADAGLYVAWNEQDKCCGMGSVQAGSVHIHDLRVALQKAQRTAVGMFAQLQAFLCSAFAKPKDEEAYPDLAPSRLGLLLV
jgi:exosome complex RNA-binding protein Rrp42 (RNase PH superfamily)